MLKSSICKVLLVISLCLSFSGAYAFRPVGHVMLQRYIAYNLPPGNIFKVAMDSFPVFAAWGAVGPDLGYVPYFEASTGGIRRKWARSDNFANMAHYYKTGSFCKALIQEAIKSNDKQLIAFAAGWLTHVAGDFGSHGIFVEPDAGYYIAVDEKKRKIHGKLEQAAESVLFLEVGKKLPNNDFYTEANLDGDSIFNKFFEPPPASYTSGYKTKTIRKGYAKVEELIRIVFDSVYKETLYLNLAKQMEKYGGALGTGAKDFGFDILPITDARARLDSGRYALLTQAFDTSFTRAMDLFTSVSKGDFSAFKDTWNLDVGPDAHTLIIRTQIGENWADGSNVNLWADITLDTEKYQERRLNFVVKAGGARYRKGDVLFAYILVTNPGFDLRKSKMVIQMKNGPKDRVVIQSVRVIYDGVPIFESNEKITLNAVFDQKTYQLASAKTP